MKPVFDKLEDFCPKALPFRTRPNGTFSLNDFLKTRILGIDLKECRDAMLHIQSSDQNKEYDPVLIDNPFLKRIIKLYNKLYVPVENHGRGFRRSVNFAKEPKSMLNVLSAIFDPLVNIVPFDRILALQVIQKMSYGSGGYSNAQYIPFNSYSCYLLPVKSLECEVDDFIGMGLLKMKNSKPNLCHSIEPFILLKEEINKYEDGLWYRLKDLIDNLLKSEDYYDFVNTGLILIGKIEPYTDQASISDPAYNAIFDSDFAPVPPQPNTKATLMTKFSLDCHCHSHSDDWKDKLLPAIINRIFLMTTE